MRRRVLAWIAAVPLILLLTVLTLVVVSLRYPSLVVNPTTAKWVVGRFVGGDKINWRSLEMRTHFVSWVDKQVEVKLHNFCVRFLPEIDVCAESIYLRADFNLRSWPPALVRVEALRVNGTKGIVNLASGAPSPQAPGKPPANVSEGREAQSEGEGWVGWLSRSRWDELRIDVSKGVIKTVSGIADLKTLLTARSAGNDLNGNIEGQVLWKKPNGFVEGTGSLNWNFYVANRQWLDHWGVKGPVRVRSGSKCLDLKLQGDHPHNSDVLNLQLAGGYSERKLRAHATAQASLNWGRQKSLRLRVSEGDLGQPWLKEASRIAVSDCAVQLLFAPEWKPDRATIRCPVNVALETPPTGSIWHDLFPRHVAILVSGDVGRRVGETREEYEGRVQVSISNLQSPLVSGTVALDSMVSGTLAEFPSAWSIDTQLSSALRLARFERVVELLSHTSAAIPAPFNVLHGPLELKINGRGDPSGGLFPFRLSTHLDSRDERFTVTGEGVFVADQVADGWKTGLRARLILDDVVLALPRFELAAPPRFFPDSRIGKTPEGPPSESSFQYRIEVRTPPNRSIRLLANLAQAPIPIAFEAILETDRPFQGTFAVSDFPLELFRRKATVEKLDVQLKPSSQNLAETESRLGGSIRVDYVDYTIRVLLSGSTEKPVIRLVSIPPLPEDQLFAALVFGRPLEELDPAQGESVGSVRAAAADGAIGLASLYLLASTPIESVGYDAQSNLVSAKVRVAEGTSLNVGAGEGQLQYVGIRKRLSRFWTITTDWTNLGYSGAPVVAAFLQWSNRY